MWYIKHERLCLTTFPGIDKRVENATYSQVFLMNDKVLGLSWVFDISSQSKLKREWKNIIVKIYAILKLFQKYLFCYASYSEFENGLFPYTNYVLVDFRTILIRYFSSHLFLSLTSSRSVFTSNILNGMLVQLTSLRISFCYSLFLSGKSSKVTRWISSVLLCG